MQLVCLVSQDDVPVVHQPSSPADRGHRGVTGNQGQGPAAKTDAIATSPNGKGSIRVLVHLDVVDSVVVGGVWALAAPTDGGWGAPADALGGGGNVGTHHRATMILVEGGQHGSGRKEQRGHILETLVLNAIMNLQSNQKQLKKKKTLGSLKVKPKDRGVGVKGQKLFLNNLLIKCER